MADMKAEIKETILNIEGGVVVLLHSYPDPDAISSALGVVQYVKHLGKKVNGVYYTGEISHPQNKSMLTLLNLTLTNYEEDPFEKGSKAILVDTPNVGEGSNQPKVNPSDVDIVVVFDHHKGKHPRGAKVEYKAVGSTATIVWEHLKSIDFPFDTDEGKTLATALVVGIKTDTDSLISSNTTDADYAAHQDLLSKADRQKLESIMKYPLPPYLFELRQKAFLEENKRIADGTIVSGLGVISPSKRDALPIIAEEFLRMSGISTSLVFAVIEDVMDMSVRSSDITVDIDTFVKKIFNAGGGKMGSGGAKIPLGFLKMDGSPEYNAKLWDLIKEATFEKVFSRVKGE